MTGTQNDILKVGTIVIVIAKGPYYDFQGRLVKVLKDREGNATYKIRFDRNKGSYRDTFYRWLKEEDLIPANDESYKLLFAD